MDDCFVSVEKVSEASKLAHNLMRLVDLRSFRLHRWVIINDGLPNEVLVNDRSDNLVLHKRFGREYTNNFRTWLVHSVRLFYSM